MLPLAITMGCPSGIGPEIILKYFAGFQNNPESPLIVVGDKNVLELYAEMLQINCTVIPWSVGDTIPTAPGAIPLLESSHLTKDSITPGHYTKQTAMAMASAITTSVSNIQGSHLSGLCTCPISKEALQESGHSFPGHTELLATLTHSASHVMMLAGSSLRVTLATIHCSIHQIPKLLNINLLVELYRTTHLSLVQDFNIPVPRIAVAALNPHAGEGGMFGKEEIDIIQPSIKKAQNEGMDLHGPFPPDTIFVKAARGEYDAVICMYHDQGLIPFKLLHFKDGVNVTLGLPIVRTSVDHGTAYDIAGKGIADPSSLTAAIELARTIIENRKHLKDA